MGECDIRFLPVVMAEWRMVRWKLCEMFVMMSRMMECGWEVR